MSHHRALKPSCLAFGVLALLLATSAESQSYGNSCQPPTPSPCAADGVCRPKRATWGYSQTRWRSWPGDPADPQPTPAGDAATGDGQGLSPFELPLPKQEDLRGPAKDDKDDAQAGDGPAEAPAQALPGLDALPAFDPQGSQLEIPKTPGMDDAPPALPTSLRQAAFSPQVPIRNLPRNSTIKSQPVRQVNWQQNHSIQLINPASAIVSEPGVDNLQQAIYYEASDRGTPSTK